MVIPGFIALKHKLKLESLCLRRKQACHAEITRMWKKKCRFFFLHGKMTCEDVHFCRLQMLERSASRMLRTDSKVTYHEYHLAVQRQGISTSHCSKGTYTYRILDPSLRGRMSTAV